MRQSSCAATSLRRPRCASCSRARRRATPRTFSSWPPQQQVAHSDEEWRKVLTRGQFGVLRAAGTELPFSSPLNKEKRAGEFW